jgi:hypothetical protein
MVEVPEELREVADAVKEFFEGLGLKPSVDKPQVDVDGSLFVAIEFNNARLSEEDFERFVDMLDSLGFYHANGAKNQVSNFLMYKRWLVYDEYRQPSTGVTVFIKYFETKSVTTSIDLDYIIVRVETPQQAVTQG